MKDRLKKLLLNDKFILVVILINSVLIYMQVAGYEDKFIGSLDMVCTLIFLFEMIVKHSEYGFREYWRDGWNRLDGTLVILSLPSVAALFIPNEYTGLSLFMIFRLLRVIRFFRVLHFFPNFTKVVQGFKAAMRESYAILLSFAVIIVIFGLLNCSLFREADPEHFQTPLFIRLYFCALLILGGIIGMSFINSIFVDAMVADNNDVVKAKLDEIQKTLDELKEKSK